MNVKKVLIIGVCFFVIIVLVGFFRYYISEKNSSDKDYLKNISYDVPKEFEKSKYGEYYHYYGNNVSCNFEVDDFSTYSYSNGKEYLEDSVSVHLNDEVSDVKEVDLNGDLWYSFNRKSGGNSSYYYAIVKDDKGYYIEYEMRDYYHGDYSNGENNFCKASYDKIISSVKLK